jgi:glyoxylase-like metal-dependent hydrolase (beta-lactamase superfamily II)
MTTAPNSGPKTLTGTHSYIVGTDPAYIIDPGPEIGVYQRALATYLRAGAPRLRPAAVLLTHGHPDHAPGAATLGGLLGIPVFGSALMSRDDARAAGVQYTYKRNQSFPVGDGVLRVLPAPGHSTDQVAFWLPEPRVLFSGDTILGQGSTLVSPPEGDMQAYMQTLERLRALDARIILPGHGPVITRPDTKITEYLTHRRERERQLLDALGTGPATVGELVAAMYHDTDPRLRDLAEGSVLAQLEKLTRESRVQRQGERYQLRQ